MLQSCTAAACSCQLCWSMDACISGLYSPQQAVPVPPPAGPPAPPWPVVSRSAQRACRSAMHQQLVVSMVQAYTTCWGACPAWQVHALVASKAAHSTSSAHAAAHSRTMHRACRDLCLALTERARCRKDAVLPPDGRMKFFRGGSSRSISSIHCCSTHTSAVSPCASMCSMQLRM